MISLQLQVKAKSISHCEVFILSGCQIYGLSVKKTTTTNTKGKYKVPTFDCQDKKFIERALKTIQTVMKKGSRAKLNREVRNKVRNTRNEKKVDAGLFHYSYTDIDILLGERSRLTGTLIIFFFPTFRGLAPCFDMDGSEEAIRFAANLAPARFAGTYDNE